MEPDSEQKAEASFLLRAGNLAAGTFNANVEDKERKVAFIVICVTIFLSGFLYTYLIPRFRLTISSLAHTFPPQRWHCSLRAIVLARQWERR